MYTQTRRNCASDAVPGTFCFSPSPQSQNSLPRFSMRLLLNFKPLFRLPKMQPKTKKTYCCNKCNILSQILRRGTSGTKDKDKSQNTLESKEEHPVCQGAKHLRAVR